MKNVKDLYPCTPLQRGLLFYNLSDPDAGVYVNQASRTLQGELDSAAFQRPSSHT